jgi:hypothetical protein
MSIFLCAVSSRSPENYQIGVHAMRWGVEEKYSGKIGGVRKGDTLVFLVGGAYRSIHRITSDPFIENEPLWPPKDESIFPHRIKISAPLYQGHAHANDLFTQISFMKNTERWQGTVQGGNGIFNSRLTEDDLQVIKNHLHPVIETGASEALEPLIQASQPPAADRQKLLFQFYSPDLERALVSLLPILGLTPVLDASASMPKKLGDVSHMVCTDRSRNHVVLHLHRGQAPHETLLNLLHDMSWVRQNVAGVREVRGLLLSETLDQAMKNLIGEVGNIEARTYRLAIELSEENVA